jgi:hypothetical protein
MPDKKLWWMALFAIAMAYFESAVVVYLRRLYDINDLMVSKPWLDSQIGTIEVGREAASLLMLLAVGWIAGHKLQSRVAYSFFAFGLWDIFYYIFLKVFIGWPNSVMDPDILFYIPLPWWGPVLAPVLISALMIVTGACVMIKAYKGIPFHVGPIEWVLLSAGVLFMLYAFMADAMKALPADAMTLGLLRPTQFNWLVFGIGYGLAAIFAWRTIKAKDSINVHRATPLSS